MGALELPRNLARAAEQDSLGRMRGWLATLPSLVRELSRRWSLQVGRPYQPGGVSSWVAPARDSAGTPLALKVGWRHEESWHEADALRLWAGAGAVHLVESWADGQTSALLLEECLPGTVLSESMAEPEQDLVVAGLLQRLWVPPPPGHAFRPLQDMCDYWADAFEARHAGSRELDAAPVRAGLALFRSLPGSAPRSVLLSTDLHAGNVLAARRQPWLAVDPKPYVGDPTYDPLQHMLNCPERLVADPAGYVRRIAGLLDLDAVRLAWWLSARCVLEWVDRPELRSVAVALAP